MGLRSRDRYGRHSCPLRLLLGCSSGSQVLHFWSVEASFGPIAAITFLLALLWYFAPRLPRSKSVLVSCHVFAFATRPIGWRIASMPFADSDSVMAVWIGGVWMGDCWMFWALRSHTHSIVMLYESLVQLLTWMPFVNGPVGFVYVPLHLDCRSTRVVRSCGSLRLLAL